MKNILVLGGAGQAGKRIVDLLLLHTDNNVTIADIDEQLNTSVFNTLTKKYSPIRIKNIFLDASKKRMLLENFRGIDTVVIASSTIKYTENIIQSILQNNCNLIEIQGPDQEKIKCFERYKKIFDERNNFYIIEAGAWPGLPLMMINFSSKLYDKLLKTEIAGFFNVDWKNIYFSPFTMPEAEKFYRENDNILGILKNGKLFAPINSEKKIFNFDGIDIKCKPTFTTEIRDIKKRFDSLEEFGFYTNFGLEDHEEITTFLCTSEGIKDNIKYQTSLKISAKIGYDITAASVVSSLLSINSNGLHLMGDLDQSKMIDYLKTFGINVNFKINKC
jgi:hypothetical protein